MFNPSVSTHASSILRISAWAAYTPSRWVHDPEVEISSAADLLDRNLVYTPLSIRPEFSPAAYLYRWVGFSIQ